MAVGGVGLEVRNAALGGNSITPSHYCVGTHVGTDVDVVSWEFAMIASRMDCRLEVFFRSVFNLPRQPMVLAWLTSGMTFQDAPDANAGPKKGDAPLLLKTKQMCNGRWMTEMCVLLTMLVLLLCVLRPATTTTAAH